MPKFSTMHNTRNSGGGGAAADAAACPVPVCSKTIHQNGDLDCRNACGC